MEQLKDKVFLIVDDEQMLRELIVLELEDYNVTCYEASSGAEAFAILRDQHIDILISDIRMPGGSGIDLLENLRKENMDKDLEIFMMSGFTDLSLGQAQDLGAVTIIGKPFIFSEIVAIIKNALSQKT